MSAARTQRVDRLSNRACAWLLATTVALLVCTYLVIWTIYSLTHLSAFPRYEQLPAGASGSMLQAEFRLIHLTQTRELAATGGGAPGMAAQNAVWVIAELEVRQQNKDPGFYCSVSLLGPDKRLWEAETVTVERATPRFCDDDEMRVGERYRFETIFEVPARYADQIYGVVLVDHSAARPHQVLTPPR